MENYYKILEVDKDASKEIIEKAYKILVKRYHPDLEDDKSKKALMEEKIKKINEAYDVLSDDEKREEYNNQLAEHSISDEKYEQVIQENIELKHALNYLKNKILNEQTSNDSNYYSSNENNQTYNNINTNNYSNQQYYNKQHSHYENHFTFSNLIKSFISIIITILIIYMIFKIPYVFNLFTQFINSNFSVLIVMVLAIIIYISRK